MSSNQQPANVAEAVLNQAHNFTYFFRYYWYLNCLEFHEVYERFTLEPNPDYI